MAAPRAALWGLRHSRLFRSHDDAADGLALARRHTRVCFAGRNYGGPDRLAYIVEYWEGASGAQTTIGREDCDTYDRNLLQIRSVNDPGWAIFSGARRVALLSTEADAGRVLSIARRHGARCYIGRGRPRDTPYAHTASYFK